MMCDRACTPPRSRSSAEDTASGRNSRGYGIPVAVFAEVDTNTVPQRKATRVERRLGLDDDEEGGDVHENDVASASLDTPRGSWPLCTQPPAVDGTGSERPSTNSLGRLTAQDFTSNRPSAGVGPQCWLTPEVNRMGTTRMIGGNFGMPVVPSLLYTPQIAPGLQARRRSLDMELESINAAHRMHPLPPVTPLIPGKLYVGGFPDEESLPILRAEGIRHIINCASQDYATQRAVAAEFHVVDLEAFDSVDYLILHHDFDNFARLVDDITERRQEKVFVHCIAGINRSVTLCCAYLMERLGCSPVDAVKVFRANGRMRILENVNFRHQLVDHYQQAVLPRLNEEEVEGTEQADGELAATQRPSTGAIFGPNW